MILRGQTLLLCVLLSLFWSDLANAQYVPPPPAYGPFEPGTTFYSDHGCQFLVMEQFKIRFPEYTHKWRGECRNGLAEGRGVIGLYDGSGKLLNAFQGDVSRGKMYFIDAINIDKNGLLKYAQRGAAPAPTAITALPQWAREIVALESTNPAPSAQSSRPAAEPTIIQLGQWPNWNPPTSLSLQMLGSDQTTQTQVWAVAANSNVCNVPYDPYTYTIVTFSANPRLLLDDIQTKKILDNAIALHAAKCSPSRFSIAIGVDKNISAIGSSFVGEAMYAATGNRAIDGVLAQRTQGPNSNNYFNKVSAQHHEAVAATQKKQQQETSQRNLDQKAPAFADKYGATGGWVNWDRLKSNPFSYEGKVLLFNAEFKRMITATSGIFEGIVVSDIPRNAFTGTNTVMLAGKVLGTTNVKNQMGGEVSLPHIKYLGHMICANSDCGGLFHTSIRAE